MPGRTSVEPGRIGTTTSIFTRGSNSNQTLVLINGVQANNPFDGRFDFGNLLDGNIERIEIFPGSQSALYGSDVIGSVIHIITKRGDRKRQVGILAEGGNNQTWRIGADASGTFQPCDQAGSIARLGTDGFFAQDQYHNTTLWDVGE